MDKSACKINYLEHIELVMSAAYTKRGDLSIDLTSAQGNNDNDFTDYNMLSYLLSW